MRAGNDGSDPDDTGASELRSRTGLASQLQPVALMKFVELGGMLVFSILAPRTMGPDLFGQFALILSLTGFLTMLCSMGGGQFVFGRFIPEYLARGEPVRARALFMHLVQFRLVSVLLAAPILYLLLGRLLREASRTTLLCATLAFVAMALAAPMFAVFFGYNRMALSMSRSALSRYLLLALLLVLGAATSLERASYALLATQVVALLVGLLLARGLFTVDPEAFHLPTLVRHIRFGAEVFASTSLLSTPRLLGETMLAFFGVPSAQIGFFNIAGSGTTALSEIIGQVPQFVIPSASLQHVQGDERARDSSLGLSAKYLSISAVAVVLGVLVLGRTAVEFLLGAEFLGVVPHLFVLSLAILPVPMVRTALSLSVVRTRAASSIQMGLAALIAFALAAPLTMRLGALGVSYGIVAAGVAAGAVAVWQMRDTRVLSEAKVLPHAVAMGIAAGVAGLWAFSPLGGILAAAAYLILLPTLRVVNVAELRMLLSAAIGRERRSGGC